ncbi:hypothetical protein VIGAN_11250700, partial [Vigna angularis var. angularis]
SPPSKVRHRRRFAVVGGSPLSKVLPHSAVAELSKVLPPSSNTSENTSPKSISSAQAKRFTKFRERKGLIEKDVVRTDRSILSNILRDILLTYSFYNFDLGYCQSKRNKKFLK